MNNMKYPPDFLEFLRRKSLGEIYSIFEEIIEECIESFSVCDFLNKNKFCEFICNTAVTIFLNRWFDIEKDEYPVFRKKIYNMLKTKYGEGLSEYYVHNISDC
jgi:hypothetical protein